MKPFVSICCITYNHEKYISDAIEGFLMQKTNFPIEIIIHDDASTDGTVDIINKYARKHPDLFITILQRENQWSKGIRPSPTYVWPRAQGKYIALCEGDDYWTDPLKLQKQVDFMESNHDCSLCFHASKRIRDNDPSNFLVHRPKIITSNNKFNIKHAILGGGGFMDTNSMLFPKESINEIPKWMQVAPVGDLPLMLILASQGNIGYIDDVMSVYRIMSSPSSWSANTKNLVKRKKHFYAIHKMWGDFDNWTEKKYHYLIIIKKLKNNWSFLKVNIKSLIN